jgi:hypothetical protein
VKYETAEAFRTALEQRLKTRRHRGIARVAIQAPLQLGDPLVLFSDLLGQLLDLLIHPQQHRDHGLTALVIDRLSLGALHD